MITCYIALGSNLDEPESQLQEAVTALSRIEGLRLAAASPVYRSAAVGPGEQPDYLNAVLAVITDLQPLALLDALQAIEDRQGRQRGERWGPRTIDLDILLYGDQRIDLPRLQVPHPEMTGRNFVLVPLADICNPALRLPDGEELGSVVGRCPDARLERTRIRLKTH
ncbi:2-amino-4-hydroxy-6-hydroxymethyldihydropteridine diphosphokinase [Parahaliea mediterranea]|uniref:2-amino-4-hydroxy-6-hydroxymethyldihydropteridine pyrophosphokinase n=1 Tax=Parahaliea mediterranea TaxID=651086 RepID=A0A939ILB1_9GAMM|nr:2-amino-4-hydroxy-6-hydroxymethyldihydropteridine diphosphokinase [Parahaliea mediterranea]MBN7795782.1 2-amino-4-hydroxy-6-hydroxymethyldihydropteridine diphosphokinase [Parahaliea mediterranea]